MSATPQPRTVHLPIRLDFLGGWSDQDLWRGPAAVLNGSFGWEHAGAGPKGLYPLTIQPDGKTRSGIQGVGTGLGVSSILKAGHRLAAGHDDWNEFALEQERAEGTRGGWQDQLGALEPGFKLITTHNHRIFSIERRDDHPLLQHLVLFDTKRRRPAKALGDQVRARMGMPSFQAWLSGAVAQARVVFQSDDVEASARMILSTWRHLVRMFPAMGHDLPESEFAWGSKLCGAGGGGYGVAFAKDPAQRCYVANHYHRMGLWADVPILLNGVQVEAAKQSRRAAA